MKNTKPHQRSMTFVEESNGNFMAKECDSQVFKWQMCFITETNKSGGWAKDSTDPRRGTRMYIR